MLELFHKAKQIAPKYGMKITKINQNLNNAAFWQWLTRIGRCNIEIFERKTGKKFLVRSENAAIARTCQMTCPKFYPKKAAKFALHHHLEWKRDTLWTCRRCGNTMVWQHRRAHMILCRLRWRKCLFYRTLYPNQAKRLNTLRFRIGTCHSRALIADKLSSVGVRPTSPTHFQQTKALAVFDCESLLLSPTAVNKRNLFYSQSTNITRLHRPLLITITYSVGNCSHIYTKHLWKRNNNYGFIKQFVKFLNKISVINYKYLKNVQYGYYFDQLKQIRQEMGYDAVKFYQIIAAENALDSYCRHLTCVSYNGLVARF